MSKRFVASLLFLAFLSGVAAPPAHAIFGIDFGLGGAAEVAKLAAILSEVKRIRDVARDTLLAAKLMKQQAEYYANLSQYLIRPSWNITWSLVPGAHCKPALWTDVFLIGRHADLALGQVRRALEWDCASVSQTTHSFRALADLSVLLDSIATHNLTDAGATRADLQNAGTAIDALLNMVQDTTSKPGISLTGNLQKSAAALATAAALTRDQTALAGEEIELQTMLLQLDRNQLASIVNSEVNRHRTHTGNFAAIEER